MESTYTVSVTCGARDVGSAEFDTLADALSHVDTWKNRDATVSLITPELTVWYTQDGVEVTDGLRVFTNDCEWGHVEFASTLSREREWFDGWFSVLLDSGAKRIYNGERMTTRTPM